jgi:hypothetical protein
VLSSAAASAPTIASAAYVSLAMVAILRCVISKLASGPPNCVRASA